MGWRVAWLGGTLALPFFTFKNTYAPARGVRATPVQLRLHFGESIFSYLFFILLRGVRRALEIRRVSDGPLT